MISIIGEQRSIALHFNAVRLEWPICEIKGWFRDDFRDGGA